MAETATVIDVDASTLLHIPQEERTTVSWNHITCTVSSKKQPEGKRILDDISGVVKPGEICAIMGPSGSGKTTLLDFLADRKKQSRHQKLEGQVAINGKPRTRAFKHYAAYVQQEDSLVGTLTVRETFAFSAALNLHNKPRAERSKTVADIIAVLGLTVCADVRIGNIFLKGVSGGQKRRVSIGIELIKRPSLIFLDEPTSGLDSQAALKIVGYLKQVANMGPTVLFTVHQPSSQVYSLFDKLMILVRGKTVYFGAGQTAMDYFGRLGHPVPTFSNPSDHFLALVNTDFEEEGAGVDTAEFVDAFAKSPEAQSIDADLLELQQQQGGAAHPDREKMGFAVPFYKQWYYLATRRMLDNTRNPAVFWVRLAMFVMLCIMIGSIYWNIGTDQNDIQDRISVLFFTAAFLVFMSIAVIPAFIEDRAVFVRERSNGYYNVAAHVLADSVVCIPALLLISISSSILVFYMVDLNGEFHVFLMALFLSLYIAEGLLSFIAALVPHYIVGMALGAGVYGAYMLTQGFFVLPENIPPYWIWCHYIGFHTYSFQIFMFNEFDGATFNSVMFPTGRQVLELYDMEDVDIGDNFAVLVAMAIVYRFLSFVALYVFRTGKH